jgi:exopolysaccharide biosynthesis polyprenyl glycosylphosphotransferase
MNIRSGWRAAYSNMTSAAINDFPAIEGRQRRFVPSYRTLIAVTLDYLSISLGWVVALLIYNVSRGAHVNNEAIKLFVFSLQYAVAFILFGRVQFLYNYDHSLLQIRSTAGILRVSCYSLLLVSVESFFGRMVIPRLLLVLSWAFITIFVLLQKHATRPMFARARAKLARDRKVLIVGSGSEARRVFSFLHNSPDLQLRPVAFFEGSSSHDSRVVYSHDYQFKDYAPVYSGDLNAAFLKRLEISDIFIADPTISPQKIVEISALSSECLAQLSFVGSVHPNFTGNPISYRVVDGLVLSSFAIGNDFNLAYELVKRFFDMLISSCMLMVSLPIFLAAAVWVKLSSDGPVFFKQERIGRDGKPFKMYKFRSMYITAPKYGRSPEDSNDPRITPAGRFLRKTSLDELPQLLNVLLGEMSLVGPRPEMPYVASQYDPQQSQRLKVQQGLTGIWQLSADRKFAIHESIEYDLYYIENRGFFLDLAILLHTAAFAMKGI